MDSSSATIANGMRYKSVRKGPAKLRAVTPTIFDEVNFNSNHCKKAGIPYRLGDDKLKRWRGTQDIIGRDTAPVLEFNYVFEPMRRHLHGDESDLRNTNTIAFTALD